LYLAQLVYVERRADLAFSPAKSIDRPRVYRRRARERSSCSRFWILRSISLGGRRPLPVRAPVNNVNSEQAVEVPVFLKLRTPCGAKSPEPVVDFLCFFAKARPRSGRNSFTMLNPTLLAMVMPKLTAPAPAEL